MNRIEKTFMLSMILFLFSIGTAYAQNFSVNTLNTQWFCGNAQFITFSPNTTYSIDSVWSNDGSGFVSVTMPDTVHTCTDYRVKIYSHITGLYSYEDTTVCIIDCHQFCDQSVVFDARNHTAQQGVYSPLSGVVSKTHQCSGIYTQLSTYENHSVVIDSGATGNFLSTYSSEVLVTPHGSLYSVGANNLKVILMSGSTAYIEYCHDCEIYVKNGAQLVFSEIGDSKIWGDSLANISGLDTSYYQSHTSNIWWSKDTLDVDIYGGTGPNHPTCPNMNPSVFQTHCGSVDLTVIGLVPNPCCLNDISVVSSPTCLGSNTNVNISSSTGSIPFSYQWSNGQNSGLAQFPVSTGNSVTVTDARGCAVTDTFNVSAIPNNMSYSLVSYNSCNGTTGDLIISASGSIAPYTYLWGNGQTSSTNTGVGFGTHLVTITDAAGCMFDTTVFVSQQTNQVVSLFPNSTLCTGQSSGDISINANGEYPLNYQWSTGETSQSINVLHGSYSVTVTDAIGCLLDTTFSTIADTTDFWIIGDSVLCTDIYHPKLGLTGNNGSVLVSNFEWSTGWSGGYVQHTVLDLSSPGTYSLTVTAVSGCQYIDSIEVVSDIHTTNIVGDNYYCEGNSTNLSSSITANYYQWNTGATTQSINVDTLGNYSLFVTNYPGVCPNLVKANVTVTERLNPIATLNTYQVFCEGDSIIATVLNTAGTGPCTYQWIGPNSFVDSGSIVTSIDTGIYTVFATDLFGCADTTSNNYQYKNVEASLVASDTIFCSNSSSMITAYLLGGTANTYEYKWNDTSYWANCPYPYHSVINPGTYTVTITDTDGCKAIDSIFVDTVTTPDVYVTTINPSCYGDLGTAILTTNATSWYWSGGNTIDTTVSFVDGNYSVNVTDLNNCSVNYTFSINEPSLLTTSMTGTDACRWVDNGTVTANVLGGTMPYSYQWDDGSTTMQKDSIPYYTSSYVTVTDTLGCSAVDSMYTSKNFWYHHNYSTTQTYCSMNNGQITLNGGNGNYSYVWSNGDQLTSLWSLSHGNYEVTITNNVDGCTDVQSFTLTEYNDPILLTTTATDITCSGDSDGSIQLLNTVTPYGGNNLYRDWRDSSGTIVSGSVSNSATSLDAGLYILQVTDNMGCVGSDTFTVSEPTPIVSMLNSSIITCYGGSDGFATVTATGGVGAYGYLWSNGAVQDSVSGLNFGLYTVTVTDSLGCIDTITGYVVQPDSLNISLSTTDVVCFGENNGSLSANTAGGISPYTYLWGAGSTNLSINNLVSGTYTVTVTDANGCTTTVIDTINEPDPLNVGLVNQASSVDFGQNLGFIDLVAIGGTSAYSFLWNTGDTSALISNLGYGIYYVTLTDANGCTAVDSFEIFDPILGISFNLEGNNDEDLPLEFKLYPNPSKGLVTIEILNYSDMSDLIIFNSLGQQVLDYKVTNTKLIDLGNLPSGTYYFKLIVGDIITTKKLIKS